jgi:hypothetical protein
MQKPTSKFYFLFFNTRFEKPIHDPKGREKNVITINTDNSIAEI